MKKKWVDERETMSLEQLEAFMEEQVATLRARRLRGDNPDYDKVVPRKLSPWERRYLELLEARREAEKELQEMNW